MHRGSLLITIVFFLVISNDAFGQLPRLQEVQKNRTSARNYKQEMKWDSACMAYQHFVTDEKYASPYDHLEFSYCCLKRNDTALFTKYLTQAIENGVDTESITTFYRKTNEKEKSRLDAFVNANFEQLHKTYLTRYDTNVINTLTAISELDQISRREMLKIAAKKGNWINDANADYLKFIGQAADSINYGRIMRLLEGDKFAGYHSCGAAAANLVTALLHFDHSYENWDYLFTKLKKSVMDGDLEPTTMASIVDRHYLRLAENPCYYYGRLQWGTQFPFYDCKNVDALRAEIGIESMKAEYDRQKRALPACYSMK